MTFKEWAKQYKAAATEDEYLKLLARREREGYGDTVAWAKKVVSDTVELVSHVVAFLTLDGRTRDVEKLLPMQVYDLEASRARYVLTFEAGTYAWTRLLIDDLKQVDLTDLYDSVGFCHLTIAHVHGTRLAPKEFARLEKAVEDDFGYDYRGPDEEVVIQFDRDACQLHVMPREAYPTR